jgi:hypothetical protein
MTCGADETAAGVAVALELASPETKNKEQINNETRKEGTIRCTATGNYISMDETYKTKVAQNRRGENGTERRKRMDGML